VAIAATTFLLLVQLSSSLAPKPPHPVQTTCHPLLTKYHLVTYHIAIITVHMSHSTEGNCHRKYGWYNLYIIVHNALNCVHAWKIKHILYIQKKQLLSKWCSAVATPIYIHHHTSNHNLTIFLSLCSVFSTVQLLLQHTPSDTGDMSWLIWNPSYIYCIWTPTQQKQFSGYKGECHIMCTKVTSVLQ